MALGVWAGLSWVGLAALGLLAVEIAGAARPPVWKGALPVAWGGTLITAGSALFTKGATPSASLYYGLIAVLNSSAILVTSGRVAGLLSRRGWRLLGLAWGFCAGFLLVAYGYVKDQSPAFYAGLLLTLVFLILCKRFFRMPTAGIQLVNTMILLAIGLPVADLFVRPPYHLEQNVDPRGRYYSYEHAQRDPGGYASWEAAYLQQTKLLWRHIFLFGAPGSDPLWRPKPNARANLFNSRIAINRKGFRGGEIPDHKGNVYRIVALGESTTFGLTLNASDKPWPVLLEQMIRKRLKLSRPVKVINAGVPGYSLRANLGRLTTRILPLKPDMIISYHGYNGFPLLDRALPESFGKAPPAWRNRPLRLLAKLEYRLKLTLYRRREAAKLSSHPPTFADPMNTEYAQDYRQLIQFARSNSIRLVLANYSMAVNERSNPRVVEFYRPVWPEVYWRIKANEVHSAIVKELAQQYPSVCFVDTHSNLDGKHDQFIDLIHFTQQGRRQLANNIFAGISKVLEQTLSLADETNTD